MVRPDESELIASYGLKTRQEMIDELVHLRVFMEDIRPLLAGLANVRGEIRVPEVEFVQGDPDLIERSLDQATGEVVWKVSEDRTRL